MKQIFTHFLIILLIIVVNGCAPTIDPPVLDAKGLDFSQFIAAGDGFTAGVSNGVMKTTGEIAPEGGLYEKAQYMSYPNLMAQSFSSLGADITFNQPLVPGDGAGRLALVNFDPHPCQGQVHMPQLRPMPLQTSLDWYALIDNTQPFHNMGIPGLRAQDIIDSVALGELPAIRGMVGDSITSYPNWLESRDATFFSLWMGMGDLLNWVYQGASNRRQPLDGPEFQAKLEMVLRSFEASGTGHGVVANIPDFTQFPFFQEVGTTIIDGNCEPHRLVMETLQFPRPLEDDELVLLPAARRITPIPGELEEGTELNPLAAKFVLDTEELTQLTAYISAYNKAIKSAVAEINQGKMTVALVDMNSFFEDIEAGTDINGATVNGEYLYGGFFSTDGLHPTGRGNAMIANEFTRTINEFFGANIPPVDPNKYPTVPFP